MLNFNIQNGINQNNEITSVLIDYKDFKVLRDVIENYGIAKLIEKAINEEKFDFEEQQDLKAYIKAKENQSEPIPFEQAFKEIEEKLR